MRTPKPALVLFALCAAIVLPFTPPLLAQGTGSISGVVSDGAGAPLAGAAVTIVGSRMATLTGPDGRYTMQAVQPGAHILRAARLGYGEAQQDVTVAAGQTATASFQLQAQALELEGVVAVGYGTQQRRDLTGSVSSINVSEVQIAPVTSVDQVLQGRAPGVHVTQSSGAPGGGVSVRIRGSNSITANSEPLYVIDGVPAFVGSGADARQINPLADLSPSDIETVEILKDASATAIYGSRGANGVVLVTTRRGRRGGNSVQFESSYGMQSVNKTMDMLNAREYAVLLNEAQTNIGRPALYTPEQVAGFAEGTDWQDEILRSAPIQNHALTASGGDETTRYLITGGFFDQDGILINSGFRRYSGRINLDREVSGRFRIGNSLALSRTQADQARTEISTTHGLLSAALALPPTVPVRDENGDYGESPFVSIPNPVATALEITDDRTASRIVGNVFGEYDLTDALRFRSSVGGSAFFERGRFYAPSYILEGQGVQGNASVASMESSELVNDNIVTYRRSLREGHDLDLTGGFTVQTFRSESLTGRAQQFATDITGANNLGAGALVQSPSSGVNEWALLSWLGRANYNLLDRYLFTVTGRNDGSSKFGAHNKWGFFPSGAFAWRVSDEAFLRDVEAISDLKLRVSYGVTGNQEIGTFQSLARLGTYSYPWGDVRQIGYAPAGSAPNPDLRWESTRQFDIGFDLALLNDRLTITSDYYHSRTDDLLLNLPMPANTGFDSQLRNVGSIANRGVELGINSVNVERTNFTWRTSLNVATNRNEVVDLGGAERIFLGGGLGLSGTFDSPEVTLLEVGRPLGVFFAYRTDGIYQVGDACTLTNAAECTPGERRFIDLNEDGAINPEDRSIIGDANPDFFGGITNNFTLGPLSLDLFFTGSYGNKVLNTMMGRAGNVTGGTNEFGTARDRWTPENPSNTVPRANISRNRRFADVFVEDGSFLRLQNLTLGYRVPEGVVPGTQQARLYVSGQNLWLLTDYSGFDPEVNSFGGARVHRGIDNGAYPRARTVNVGVNVIF